MFATIKLYPLKYSIHREKNYTFAVQYKTRWGILFLSTTIEDAEIQ